MPAITALRDALADRRQARAKRRQLERELAGFTTPAQRLDLDAILARHAGRETEEIRRILASQDVARVARARASTGGHLVG